MITALCTAGRTWHASVTNAADQVNIPSDKGILVGMQRICIEALANHQIKLAACETGHQVASDTVVGGSERVLRQTVVGMIKGAELGEHNSPGEATVYVLRGRVRVTSQGASWIVRAGDLVKVPEARSSLQALEDSALLLTVVKLAEETPGEEFLSHAAPVSMVASAT